MAHRSLAAYHYVDPRRQAVHRMIRRHVTDPGFVHFGDGDDLLVFHIDGPWLSLEGCIGACDVRVVKGMAALTLPAGFPDTLAGGMLGRRVDALVDNPALAGRDYRVRRVREAKSGAGPTLVFATGGARFAMPWPGMQAPAGAGALVGRARKGLAWATAADLPWSSAGRVAENYAATTGGGA